MKKHVLTGVALLLAAAGTAVAQPTIDGALGTGESGLYGPILWVQNVPTGFVDNVSGGTCNEANVGNPGTVSTGIELAIPLTAIGSPAGSVRVCVFVNSGDHTFASNQVLGGLPAVSPNLASPRLVDFSAIAGDQFFTATALAGTSPVIDGTKDAAYPLALKLQTTRTGFGDSTDGLTDQANGSELDGAYATIRNGTLFVMLTGNLESNFNKLEFFIDTGTASGFNQLDSASVFQVIDEQSPGDGALQRMQGNGTDPGLKFDAAFTADYLITFGAGGAGPGMISHYPNIADLSVAGGPGVYLGSVLTGSGSGVLAGGTNPDNIEVAVNNSNIAGVPAPCPPPAGNRDNSNGSELDGLYGYIDSAAGKMYLLLTGNLQSNYSKIDLFFDVTPADGQSPLRGDNVDIDFNGLNRMGGNGVNPGLTFDTGVFADYWVAFTNGSGPQVFANAAVLRADGPRKDFGGNNLDYGAYDGGSKPLFDPITFSGPRLDPQDGFTPQIFTNFAPRTAAESLTIDPTMPVGTPGLLRVAIDNSNILGVTTTSAAGAASVTTGLELELTLSELGWDGVSCIKVMGAVQNGGHSVMSNQVIGGLPDGSANLGETRLVNFSAIAGNQFVEICPASPCGSADFDGDGDTGTDLDIEAFFACLGGDCCATCGSADFDGDGDTGTDLDIEAFFRVLGGGEC